jgi:glycosyltransferase involved in cell wall biosynthesis
MKSVSITVGIPAYNEAANIRQLLQSLLDQVLLSATLHEIIVIADGCTDNTLTLVKSMPDPRIKIVYHSVRKGKSFAQNEIFLLANGDILVLLDGDVLPMGTQFLETIIQPILCDPEVGLVGADTMCAPPETFIECVLAESHRFKTTLYRTLRGGSNLYLCHGRARAFSCRFYSEFSWPEQYPEDAYSYLICLQKNFKFVYAPKAQIVFRSPQTIADHFKQSHRFGLERKHMVKNYPSNLAHRQYFIPPLRFIFVAIKALIKHPLLISTYLAITTCGRLIFLFNHVYYHSRYKPSISTKRV